MNNKFNPKAIKARLTVDDHKKIMKALDIPAYTESSSCITYWSGDKNRDAMKGSPKLVFYKDTKIYMGYTASTSYDIISLCQVRLGLLGQPHTFLDAINFIIETTGLEIDAVKRINAPHVCDWSGLEKFIRFRSTGSTLESYDKSILNQLDHSIPQQWLDEGISLETMVKYQIGYYDRLDATTIPCFNRSGELIGIRCRHWRPEEIEQGKYRPLSLLDGTTFKFPTNQVFFGINWNWGEIERTGAVMIVESEKAVMWLDSLYHEKNVALGMYGKNLGLQRRNQLIKLGVDKVIYIPDNDWIGKTKSDFDRWEQDVIKFGNQFKGYANVDVVWDNLGLLKEKQNATDNGIETWNKLFDNKEVLI